MTAANSADEPAPFQPDALFYRYVHPKLAGEDGWPNSGAFDDDELSVDWAEQTDLERVRDRRPGRGVVGLTKAVCEELGLAIVHDPLPDNPAHCLILGRKSGSIRRRLKERAIRLRPAAIPEIQ